MKLTNITGQQFYDLLKSENNELRDYNIDLTVGLTINISKLTLKNTISNCKFNGRFKIFDPLVASK